MNNEKTKTDRELDNIPKTLDHLFCLILDKYKNQLIKGLWNFLVYLALFCIFKIIFDFLNFTYFTDILF
jgi:hypothetical protein